MPCDLLTSYLSSPNGEERIEITDKITLCSLRRFEGEKTEERLSFLRQLNRFAIDEFRIDSYSALYFFSYGNTSIELDVSVGDVISIIPYIRYNIESVGHDMSGLIELDYLVYCVLKEQKLQKN